MPISDAGADVARSPVGREVPWETLVSVCEQLAAEYDPGRIHAAVRWRGLWMVGGIEAPQFAIFEPVMRRRPSSRDWQEVAPIEEATRRAVAVLREGT